MRTTLWDMLLWIAVTSFFLGTAMPSGAASYPAISGNNGSEWITRVLALSYNNETGQETDGYSYFTSDSAKVTPGIGLPYGLSVTINANSAEYIRAFFDWNQDGDFNDIGETVSVASNVNSAGPYNVGFFVPANAVPGETRMRVVLKSGAPPPSFGDIGLGEAEDYLIIVLPIFGNNGDGWITNVTFGAIDNESGVDDIGYGDYTSLQTRVKPGAIYPLSITMNHWVVMTNWFISTFFDWNQDGDFNDSGENYVVAEGVDTNGPHTINVSVPDGALSNGNTIMRVVLKWNGPPPSSGDIVYGEAEDYTINMNNFPWLMFLSASIAKDEPVPVPTPFSISSSSFSYNQVIPIEYTLYGSNISPQLSWQNAPAGTDSFMLTVIDPDGGDWLHWKVKLPGTTTSLAENAGASGGANLPIGSTRYDNDFKGLGISGADGTDYDGPRPPAGTGVHHYNYKVTALDAGGNELDSATITGTYEEP